MLTFRTKLSAYLSQMRNETKEIKQEINAVVAMMHESDKNKIIESYDEEEAAKIEINFAQDFVPVQPSMVYLKVNEGNKHDEINENANEKEV